MAAAAEVRQLVAAGQHFLASFEEELCGPTGVRINAALSNFAAEATALKLGDLFSFSNVERVCNTADGVRPYLVSPEKGLRTLVAAAIDKASGPASSRVDAVCDLLREGLALAAAKVADAGSDSKTEEEDVPEISPVALAAVEREAARLLDSWRRSASSLVSSLVSFEREVIDAKLFRAIAGIGPSLGAADRAGSSAVPAQAPVPAALSAPAARGPMSAAPFRGGGATGRSLDDLDAQRPRGPLYRRMAADPGVDPRTCLMGDLEKVGCEDSLGPLSSGGFETCGVLV